MLRVVAGRYELLEKIGEGGMGKVFKARDLKLDRVIALKGLGRSGPDDLQRFTREARTAARLRHPHIVEVYDIVNDGDDHFITMKLIEGDSLADDGPRRRRLEALAQAAEALDYAHREGVIHRDIKPGNILIDRQGVAYLSDFGLARRPAGDSRVTASGAVVGTPSYMAPEQARGDEKRVDALSDVYGLGATLYEILAGRPPFRHDAVFDALRAAIDDDPMAPSKIMGDVPRDLDAVCLKALSKEKARRYASAGAFAQDLRRHLAGDPVLASPPSTLYRMRRFVARRKVLVSAVAITLIVAGAAGFFMTRGDRRRIATGEKYRRLQEKLSPIAARIQELRPYFYIPDVDVQSALAKVGASLDELQKLLKDADDLAEAEPWLLLGMGRYFTGDLSEAETALKRAVTINAAEGRAHFYLGKICLERSMAARVQAERGAKRNAEPRLAAEAAGHFAKAGAGDEVDRLIVAGYQALVRAEYKEVHRIGTDGWARFGKALGSEEFWMLRSMAVSDTATQIDMLGRALDRRPQYPWALFMRGTEFGFAGKPREAVDDLTRAIGMNPRFAMAFGNRAIYLHKLGRDDEAMADFETALRLEPDNTQPVFNRATMLTDLDDHAGAIRDLDDLLRRDPKHVDALCNRARSKTETDRFDEAEDDYTRAIDLEPGNDRAWRGRSAARRRRGDLVGAADDAERAMQLVPDNWRCWFQRGLVRESQRRLADAMNDFDRAIALDPAAPEALVARADLHHHTGGQAAALADLDRAVAADPSFYNAWNNRGILKVLVGNSRAAIADFDEAIRLKPRRAEAYAARCNAKVQLGEFKAAIEDGTRAIELNPKFAGGHVNRGTARDRSGDKQGAIRDYTSALEVEPGLAQALYNRGVTKSDLKDWAGAEADLTAAVTSNPKHATAWLARAQCRNHLRNVEGMRHDVRKALEVASPTWPHRAQAERILKDLEK